MENYEFAVSTKPSNSFVHVVEVGQNVSPLTQLYIRTGPPTGFSEDLRLYDFGKFNIATYGQPGNSTNAGLIGELWVTYDVEFFKPKYRAAQGSGILMDHYYLVWKTPSFPEGPNAPTNLRLMGDQPNVIIKPNNAQPPYPHGWGTIGTTLVPYTNTGADAAVSVIEISEFGAVSQQSRLLRILKMLCPSQPTCLVGMIQIHLQLCRLRHLKSGKSDDQTLWLELRLSLVLRCLFHL